MIVPRVGINHLRKIDYTEILGLPATLTTSDYIPFEFSFRISNLDDKETLYLSNVELIHEYKRTITQKMELATSTDPIILGNKTDANSFWESSKGRFEYSDEEEPTDVNFLAAKKEKKETEKEYLYTSHDITVSTSDVEVVSLGLYSNTLENRNFKLAKKKEVVQPDTIRYFRFQFLISKDVLEKYTSIRVDKDDIFEISRPQSRDVIDLVHQQDPIELEGLSSLRLKVRLTLSAAEREGEFDFTRYYYYHSN